MNFKWCRIFVSLLSCSWVNSTVAWWHTARIPPVCHPPPPEVRLAPGPCEVCAPCSHGPGRRLWRRCSVCWDVEAVRHWPVCARPDERLFLDGRPFCLCFPFDCLLVAAEVDACCRRRRRRRLPGAPYLLIFLGCSPPPQYYD